ncbi:MAG: hypothetical protein HOV94_41260 [Saccharothrix sp.]|nr:hypothetical protein [Saccharothrix sp.]
MAWSAPMTAIANSAFTAAHFNQFVRDNLNETAPAKATAAGRVFVSTGANSIAERAPTRAVVGTAEATSSTSYTNLTTSGPAVTVTTGASALVLWTATTQSNTANALCYMSLEISGATTQAASDTWSLSVIHPVAATNLKYAAFYFFPLTAGNNTFTTKYRVSAGTGTFTNRQLFVFPL